jgi:G patch domain-containing protein 1
MAQKRSRATAFESDTTILYGTPLPPIDSEARDDGSYVPVWKQEATDERGRKRFHGAFTGGFSAGYFNTVGSKEGWVPATFVSSRSNRAKDQKPQQKPEDFMDEEDLAAQEDSKKFSTSNNFSGLGSTVEDSIRRDALIDLMSPSSSIGVKLLQKMGWKEGQGIGPRIRRKAHLENGQPAEQNTHWFAPPDTKMISFYRKTDSKGLGFMSEAALPPVTSQNGVRMDDDDDASVLARSRSKLNQSSKATKKASFGVGVLNDTGSDDEDPYSMGPKLSYNRSIGAVKKAKKPKAGLVTSSNPLLSSKPIFVSKKKLTTNLRKCHDDRLPLDGFILSSTPLTISISTKYAPPKVPPDWKSARIPISSPQSESALSSTVNYQSPADSAKASTLNPLSRAHLLGETPLPSKSVFSFLTPSSRDRLVSATNNPRLPAAGSEPAPEEYRLSEPEKAKSLWSRVPKLDAAVAKAALDRADFMPYADDNAKRARYRAFLEGAARQSGEMPPRKEEHGVDEWVAEMREFAQAAMVFRPMTGLMASRFTSSSSSGPKFEGGEDPQNGENALVRASAKKPEDPAEAAAKMGMFGTMTRSIGNFAPTRLVCKRFGVKVPEAVAGFEEEDSITVEEPVSNRILERMKMETMGRGSMVLGREHETYTESPPVVPDTRKEEPVDVEKNEALEKERPGDAVFKAIFGSDDEDDD